MKVGAANRRSRDANNGVAALTNSRLGFGLPLSLPGTVVDQCLHDAVDARITRRPIGQGPSTSLNSTVVQSNQSVWRSSETLSICAHLRRERLGRSPPPTRPSTPPFQRPTSTGRPFARQICVRFACLDARPTDGFRSARRSMRVRALPRRGRSSVVRGTGA
jgi:hypothetical protein